MSFAVDFDQLEFRGRLKWAFVTLWENLAISLVAAAHGKWASCMPWMRKCEAHLNKGLLSDLDFKDPFVCLFVCSRGDTRSVTTGSILLKLGQSPINVSRMDYSRILTSKTHLLSECLDRGIRKTSSIGWLQCWWDMKYWVDIYSHSPKIGLARSCVPPCSWRYVITYF